MTARPDTWMPVYWGDYARDTGHLGALEHGAYLMLIKHYWCTGRPLPDDDNVLWRIACCSSKKQWLNLRLTIAQFFSVGNSVWSHNRIEDELNKAFKNIDRYSKLGRASADARSKARSTHVLTSPQRGGSPSSAASPSPSSDKKEADASARGREVGNRVLDIIGVGSDPRWFGHAGRVHFWLGNGADPELDIYPAIQAVMARRNGQGPPRSLNYFDGPIADAYAARTKPMPEGNPNGQSQQAGPRDREATSAAVAAMLDERDRKDLERRAGGDAPAVLPAVSGDHG